MKPYLLRTPTYDPTSGGIKVMYGLYGWLLAKGMPAYLNTKIDVESVGIYPEIYDGNDMFANKVVRYILQTPGMMGRFEDGAYVPSPTAFDPKDEKYVFSKVYDEWDTDKDHIIFLPIIPLSIFRDFKKKRTKTAFYVGKGLNMGNHPKDAIELTRQQTQDQTWLAEFLNDCQVLYVYDRMSAIMEVARLCGCRIQYFGELPKEKLELYEPGMNGLGYKDEEVTLKTFSFRQDYEELIKVFEKKLDKFIERTQK